MAIRSSDVIAPPTSSPSPSSSGCRRLALKGWDRGINSRHRGRVRYGPPSCHWHKRRHRTLCPRRQAGPGTWRRCGIDILSVDYAPHGVNPLTALTFTIHLLGTHSDLSEDMRELVRSTGEMLDRITASVRMVLIEKPPG